MTLIPQIATTRVSGDSTCKPRLVRHLLILLTCLPFAAFASAEPAFRAALVTGNSVYDDAALMQAYRGELGQPLTADRIAAIVDSVEAMYEADGRPRPQVRVSMQLVERGILGIAIDERTEAAGAYELQGDAGPHRALIERWLAEVTASDASRNEMAAVVSRINRLPGIKARARLAPGGRLAVSLAYKPVEAAVFATNRGIEDLGGNIFAGRVRFNALADSLGVVAVKTTAASALDQYHGYGIGLEKKFFDRGLEFHANVSRSSAEPEVAIGSSPRLFDRQRVRAGFRQNLATDRYFRWSWGVEFQARNFEYTNPDDASGTVLRDERTRSIVFDTRVALRRDSGAIWRGSLYGSKGFEGMGAGIESVSTAPERRELDFWLAGFELTRVSRIGDAWRLEAGVAGQYSDSILPSSERFRIGGRSYGRGYELSEVSGDTGASAKLELGRDVVETDGVFGTISAYGFYDIGAIWPEDYSGRQTAASGGLGLETRGDRLRAYVEAAQPLTRPSEIDGNDVKFFGGLSLRF